MGSRCCRRARGHQRAGFFAAAIFEVGVLDAVRAEESAHADVYAFLLWRLGLAKLRE